MTGPAGTVSSEPVRGPGGYDGFRATLKLVGTGPRGSRDLTFDEARAATAAVLAGEATPAQAGAFLVAMRIKGEGPAELAGVAQALRDRAAVLRYDGGAPVVVSVGAFDGLASAPPLGLAASVCAAAAGAAVVTACGDRLGPKHGVTVADVLLALGGPARPTPAQSEAMLARSGVAVVHAGEAVAGWDAVTALREEIGLRGPLHSAEKLVDWFGARRFVVGHTHLGYGAKLLGALEVLGAQRAIAVRGIEGSDVLRPGRPSASALHGPVELPEQLGVTLRGDPDPGVAARLTRAVLGGEDDGPARRAVTLSAAVRLMAAGVARDAAEGLRRAEQAIAGGSAAATLDALLAA